MSMYNNFKDIINVLNFDEDLLRLLYYAPANLANDTPDPLDTSLDNMLDMREEVIWGIRDDRILFIPKTDDLVPDNPICRILVYAGRRTPERNNYLFAAQEVIVDIFCHQSFENGDLRSAKISDRLNTLFCQERITGIGLMDYVGGGQTNAPTGYVGYKVIFKFGSFKK